MKEKKFVKIKSFTRSSKFGRTVTVKGFVRDASNVGGPKKPGMHTVAFRLHEDTLCLLEEALGEFPELNKSQLVEKAILAFAGAALR
jgi:hypothetical protein